MSENSSSYDPNDEQAANLTPPEQREKLSPIISTNLDKLLYGFWYVDPERIPTWGGMGAHPEWRKGVRIRGTTERKGIVETYFGIIYKTETGEITGPPEEYETDEYSIIDTWMMEEGEPRDPYPKAKYTIRTQLPEGSLPHHAFAAALTGEPNLFEDYGPIILPRRLIKGEEVNLGMRFVPWEHEGDKTAQRTITTFNRMYGPDWMKGIPEI